MNQFLKILIIAGIIIGLVVLITVAGAPSNNPSSQGSGKTYTCTITADVGTQHIRIVNQNIPAGITVQVTELPFSFNFTGNDVLSFNATSKEGFKFNVWWHIGDGRFYSNNPFTFKATKSFHLECWTLTTEEWQNEP